MKPATTVKLSELKTLLDCIKNNNKDLVLIQDKIESTYSYTFDYDNIVNILMSLVVYKPQVNIETAKTILVMFGIEIN